MTSPAFAAAALIAGLVSFLSPCVLPLVPGYVSMISGVGARQLREERIAVAGLSAGAWILAHVPHSPNSRGASPAIAADDDGWVGKMAPDFQLTALDGQRVRLSELRGRVVLVNFWATWCAPCRMEMPWLAEFDTRYRAQGLTILGVSVDDAGEERVANFVRQRQVRYPILLKDDAVEALYGGVRFLPQTFFVGRDGRILARVYGIRTRADFEADIAGALGLNSPPG